MVDCSGLENRYVGNPGVGGSNPPLSAAANSLLELFAIGGICWTVLVGAT